jgi:hypothetical protein
MPNTSVQTIAGRVRVNPPLSADLIRYEFLSLSNAEPNLSLPSLATNPSAYSFLLSDSLTGYRAWSDNFFYDILNDNIGIGVEFPNEKLTVVGNISATGSIFGNIISPIIPAAAGDEGFVQFNGNNILSADAGFVYKKSLSSLQVGNRNLVTGQQATIAGGFNNTAAGNFSFIGSGDTNNNPSVAAVIVGGKSNIATGDYSFIGGGRDNQTNDIYAGVVTGFNNDASGLASFIGGGEDNTITPGTQNNAILGGVNNTLNHNDSFIVGSNISSVSANFTYVENLEVVKQTIFNGSIAEKYNNTVPVSNVANINLLNGTTFNLLLTANINSFNLTNIIADKVNSFALFVEQDGSGGKSVNWTFTGKTLKWANGGLAPVVTAAAGSVDFFTFVTNDGGTTWYGLIPGQNFQ